MRPGHPDGAFGSRCDLYVRRELELLRACVGAPSLEHRVEGRPGRPVMAITTHAVPVLGSPASCLPPKALAGNPLALTVDFSDAPSSHHTCCTRATLPGDPATPRFGLQRAMSWSHDTAAISFPGSSASVP